MKYKGLLLLSLILLVLPLGFPQISWYQAIFLSLVLFIRNKKLLIQYGKFFLSSMIFLLFIYALAGDWEMGLHTAGLLFSSSISLQLYFGFFPKISIYELLMKTGVPKRISFIIYASLNYVSFITPIIGKIQDAQRLRGVEIKKGIRGLLHLHILLIPLMVRLLRGSNHLAESLYLRAGKTTLKSTQQTYS